MIPENKVKFKILKSGWGLDNEVELFWTGWVANTTLLSLWLKSKDTIRGQSKFIGERRLNWFRNFFITTITKPYYQHVRANKRRKQPYLESILCIYCIIHFNITWRFLPPEQDFLTSLLQLILWLFFNHKTHF